jgi:uridylate kinase
MGYKRILLKLSGEALMGSEGYGIDPETLNHVAAQILDVAALGTQIGVVVGAGNIYRGMRAEKQGIERITGDYMGMVATVINALALQDRLEKLGLHVRIQTALQMSGIAEPYIRRRALKHLEKGRILIFGCGTGNPFFTTDTAAALRAVEIGADALFKATKVDGVYDKDPVTHQDATFFQEISYRDVIDRDLKVMDMTAITLCMENNLPIVVFNLRGKDAMKRVVQGERLGTIVRR